MDTLWPYAAALVPTLVVAGFFYALMKRIIEGDRRERLAQKRFEADADRRAMTSENAEDSPENGHPGDH